MKPLRSRMTRAFTLLEVMISTVIFAMVLVLLSSITGNVVDVWRDGESRLETSQGARAALELITRELTPAVVDTRMQFAVVPAETLAGRGAKFVVDRSPALLWMAPLGQRGELRCIGYYLTRDEERGFYRLKRIYIKPDNPSGYFPKMLNMANPRDPELRINPLDAQWFYRNWDATAFAEEDATNDRAVVSTAADNVVAFWAQCIDLAGNPVPWLANAPRHGGSDMIYNSAAYFQMSTTSAFEGGGTTVFTARTKQSMKANRLPAAIDLTVVVIDSATLSQGLPIPDVQNVMRDDGSLDVEESIRQFSRALLESNIKTARTFTTRVNLLNGQ